MASPEKRLQNDPKKRPRPQEVRNKRKEEKQQEDRSVDEASRESFPASDSPAWSVPVKRKKRL